MACHSHPTHPPRCSADEHLTALVPCACIAASLRLCASSRRPQGWARELHTRGPPTWQASQLANIEHAHARAGLWRQGTSLRAGGGSSLSLAMTVLTVCTLMRHATLEQPVNVCLGATVYNSVVIRPRGTLYPSGSTREWLACIALRAAIGPPCHMVCDVSCHVRVKCASRSGVCPRLSPSKFVEWLKAICALVMTRSPPHTRAQRGDTRRRAGSGPAASAGDLELREWLVA